MKKILFLFVCLFVSMAGMAWDIYQDSIYFNIVDATKHTVEVCAGEKPYAGDIVIPESVSLGRNNYKVTGIGKEAFKEQELVTSVTMPSTIKYIDDEAFCSCEGLTSITLPNSVLSLGERSFFNCMNLETVNFGNSLQSIGPYAFSSCEALKEATLPKSLTNTERGLFLACSNLKRVHFEGEIPWIEQQMFSGCKSLVSLTTATSHPEDGTLHIPSNIKYIGTMAFDRTNFKKLTMSNSVTRIHYDAFSNCSALKSIQLSNTLESIGEYAFAFSGITEVDIPESVTTIETRAFSACDNLESVKLPNLETIDQGILAECDNLRRVIIPNSVKTLGEYAIQGCKNLTYVTIGSSVEEIRANCFSHNFKLSVLDVYATTPPVLDKETFSNESYNALVVVPNGCAEKYKQAPYWKNFKCIQEGTSDSYDVNKDGYINAADVVSIYNRIITGE